MKQLRTAVALIAALVLAGCAGMNSVVSDVSSYSQWPAARAPGSYVFERLPSQQAKAPLQDTLEAAARDALAHACFTEAKDAQSADVQVHGQASHADGQAFEVGVGPGQAEVVRQQGEQGIVQRSHAECTVVGPQAGGLDHFTKVELDAQTRQVALLEGLEHPGEEVLERVAQRQALGPAGLLQVVGVGTDRLDEHCPVERGLVAEVVADRRDVHAGRLGQVPHRCLGVT